MQTQPRYTLDKSKPHNWRKGLYLVLDKGKETKAYASEQVDFSEDCEVCRGMFHGGEFHGGVFYGGLFQDGEFRGGVFYGGVFQDGKFHGGVFRGGWFYGGVFHGGVFRSGWFYGGVFCEGWLPLQIQGSKHFVNIPDGKKIKIGCHEKTPEQWANEYGEIGKEERYTDAEISEYKRYIDIATTMIQEAK